MRLYKRTNGYWYFEFERNHPKSLRTKNFLVAKRLYLNMGGKIHNRISQILDKIKIGTETECWPWMGRKGGAGYGLILYHDKASTAHRVVYQLLVGPVPTDKEVLHLCEHRLCCNPRHLLVGSHRENVSLDSAKRNLRRFYGWTHEEMLKQLRINGGG